MIEEFERGHQQGETSAWTEIALIAINKLHVDDKAYAGLVVWKSQTIAALRRLCDEFGDNEWPDTLHPADVLKNHLGKIR